MGPSATILLSTLIISFLPASECVIYGKFIQIGDMHFDPTYEDSGDSCNTEIPKEERKPYGNYNCDSPRQLVEHAVKEVNRHIYEADFVMWSGDVPSHVRNASMLDVEKVIDVMNLTSHLIRDGIHHEMPIFPLMGNHDYFPKDQLPVTGGLYPRIADIFCSVFDIDQDKDGCDKLREAGYYSRLINNTLHLLMLNTNLYSSSNKEVDENDSDPAGQFAWMRDKFTTARQNGQMTHVFAHIPPGMFETEENLLWFREGFNKEFNKIIREFSDVIIGVYSAHAHTDSFRIYYKNDEPVVPLLISPSVTPWRWPGGDGKTIPRNPALRVIYFRNEGTMYLTNYDQFYLRLKKANDAPIGATVAWEKEYQFKSYEGAENATAKALHTVSRNFAKYASEEFHKYFERNSVMIQAAKDKPPGLDYVCSQRCKWAHICAIQNVDVEEYTQCLENVRSAAQSLFNSVTIALPFISLFLTNIFFNF